MSERERDSMSLERQTSLTTETQNQNIPYISFEKHCYSKRRSGSTGHGWVVPTLMQT